MRQAEAEETHCKSCLEYVEAGAIVVCRRRGETADEEQHAGVVEKLTAKINQSLSKSVRRRKDRKM